MESLLKPCFVRLVRLKTTQASEAKPNSKSTDIPQKIRPLKKEMRCSMCHKTCKSQYELERHFRVHTGERPFACSSCNKRFKSESEVNHHSSMVHSEIRPISCLWCDKTFKTNYILMAHLLAHTKEKSYFCKKCPLSCATSTSLIQHALIKHNSGKGKKCESCNKMFYAASQLERHRRIHTEERPYSCSVCGKSFAVKCSLVRHFRIHSESRPFKCTKCPKTFRFQSNLHSHTLNIHEKVRNFHCGICDKTFFEKSKRDDHINSHLNEKPLVCPKCPKRFTHRSNLVYHLKAIHDNTRDFKCSQCPLGYVKQIHLDQHFLRKHTNPSERPFACLFCSKMYCVRGELERHLRSHLGEKPYFCKFCSFSTGTSGYLRIHVRKLHESCTE